MITSKELSYKLVMLLALLSGRRCQTLHCLSVSSLKMSDSKCMFAMDVLNSLAKENIWHLRCSWLSVKMKKCVVSVLKEYLCRTKEIQAKENQVLLSYQAPHKPVSRNTLARWL